MRLGAPLKLRRQHPPSRQIIGLDGRATVLRETAKSLDMNVDKIVPSPTTLAMRAKVAAAQAMMQGGGAPAGGGAAAANPPGATATPDPFPGATPPGPPVPAGSTNRQLPNGQGPATDNFGPTT